MTRLTPEREAEIANSSAGLHGSDVRAFKMITDLLSEITELRKEKDLAESERIEWVKRGERSEELVSELRAYSTSLESALSRIAEPVSRIDGMIIADMGLKHFTQQVATRALLQTVSGSLLVMHEVEEALKYSAVLFESMGQDRQADHLDKTIQRLMVFLGKREK